MSGLTWQVSATYSTPEQATMAMGILRQTAPDNFRLEVVERDTSRSVWIENGNVSYRPTLK